MVITQGEAASLSIYTTKVVCTSDNVDNKCGMIQ